MRISVARVCIFVFVNLCVKFRKGDTNFRKLKQIRFLFQEPKKTWIYNQFWGEKENVWGFCYREKMIPRKIKHAFERNLYWSRQPVRPWQWLYRQVWVMRNNTRIQAMASWQGCILQHKWLRVSWWCRVY